MSLGEFGRRPTTIGLVCPSQGDAWLGGLNHVQHLTLCMAATNGALRPRDVWWGTPCPADDPFASLRWLLGEPISLQLPHTLWGRAARAVRRTSWRRRPSTLADVFQAAGIDVLFPSSPCDRPGIPVVGWITDLQYVHLPQYYTQEQRDAFQRLYQQVLEESTLVMLSSAAAKADLDAAFPDLAHKARVVRPCSVPTGEWWEASPEEVARQLELPAKYFVVSNQVCAHKNHRTLFRAMARLQGDGLPVELVCTGLKADYRDPGFFARLEAEAEALGVAARVRFLGVVPRRAHVALLRGAVALLQPSEFEGWGFALSDAQAVGTPVIASDIPVHHEHPAVGLRFASVHDEESWAAAMAEAWGAGEGSRRVADEVSPIAAVERRRVATQLENLFAEALRLGSPVPHDGPG